MKKALSIIVILFVSLPLMCLIIEKKGYGSSIAEARTEAASELSKYLYINVNTTTITTMADNGSGVEASYYAGTEIRSQLPLLGIEYSDGIEAGVYVSTAKMDSLISLPLYYERLNTVIDSMILPSLEGIGSIEATRILNNVLLDYEEVRKLKYIVVALGGVFEKYPAISESEIKALLIKLNGTVDSFDKAAFVLTQDCALTDIFVEQPLPTLDDVASDFSIVFSEVLKSALGGKIVSEMQSARYFFSTRYSEDQDGNLFVVANLNDINGNNVFSSSVTIPATLINGIKIYADGYDFRKAINRGDSVANDFNVFIRINGGNTGSTFHGGDELYIEVKASQPCYFYVVGYVFDECDNEFSYLFPITVSGDGKEMFVGRIGSENVGKWLVINPTYDGYIFPIEIIPPYGVETLQVYASTTTDYSEFLYRIPSWKETESFYLITGEPSQVLSNTRALNVKKAVSKEKNAETAEANVTYRSIE